MVPARWSTGGAGVVDAGMAAADRYFLASSHGGVKFDVVIDYLRGCRRDVQQSHLVPEAPRLALSLPEPPRALEKSFLNALSQPSRAAARFPNQTAQSMDPGG